MPLQAVDRGSNGELMTLDAFTGPLPLTRSEIVRAVPRHAVGVFAVGQLNRRGRFGIVTRMGRADRDLVDELTKFEGRYEAFLFTVTSSPARACDLECDLYHQLRRPDLPHPVPPPGAGWTCAVCRSRRASSPCR